LSRAAIGLTAGENFAALRQFAETGHNQALPARLSAANVVSELTDFGDVRSFGTPCLQGRQVRCSIRSFRGQVKRVDSPSDNCARRWPIVAGAALLAVVLAGCSIPLSDMPVIGLPANTPPRPAAPGEYLPVHDVPEARSEAVLTPEQQEKIEKDLVAARNRQAAGVQKAARDQN